MKTGYELWKGVWYATQCNVDSDADENPERVYVDNALAVRAPALLEFLRKIVETGEHRIHYNGMLTGSVHSETCAQCIALMALRSEERP